MTSRNFSRPAPNSSSGSRGRSAPRGFIRSGRPIGNRPVRRSYTSNTTRGSVATGTPNSNRPNPWNALRVAKTPPPLIATYPMRINKYLAHKGFETRRGADGLITSNKVLINGRIAVLGDKVNETDQVEVRQDKAAKDAEKIYLAYHKPAGQDTMDIKAIEKTADKANIFPIGRLEKESAGLIILTNDGRITDRLLNPAHAHEKEYEVMLDKTYSPSLIKILTDRLAHTQTHPASITPIDNRSFKLTLRDPGNTTIIRACSELGFQVTRITRTRILNIRVDGIREGGWRKLTAAEQTAFLNTLGL